MMEFEVFALLKMSTETIRNSKHCTKNEEIALYCHFTKIITEPGTRS